MIRMDLNEGPPPPVRMLRRIMNEAAPALAWYPEYGPLLDAASRAFRVSAGEILPLNGGDEGIRLVTQAFLRRGGNLLISTPGFFMYSVYAGLEQANIRQIPLESGFRQNLAAFREALPQAGLIILASPHNPTGQRVPEGELRELIRDAAGLPFLLDEVYAPFCGQDGAAWIREFPHLMVLRSMSKSHGLPGLRCGFLLAGAKLVSRLAPLRSPYNVTAPATALAAAILARDRNAGLRLQKAIQARRMIQDLLRSAGLETGESDTHFFLARLDTLAGQFCRHFRQRGILIKDMSATLPGWVRISVIGKSQAHAFQIAFSAWQNSTKQGASYAE